MHLHRLPLISVLVIMSLLQSCSNNKDSKAYLWPPVDAGFDSVNCQLEYDFNDFKRPEFLQAKIDLLDSIAQSSKGENTTLMQVRALYWRSRFIDRYGSKDSALNLIRKAVTLVDSSRFTYDWLRVKSQLYVSSDSVNGAEEFRHYEEAINFAKKIGDDGYLIQTGITMGNLMNSIGEYEKALIYFNMADSLSRKTGQWKLPIKNSINVASVMEHMGRTAESDSMLLSLIGHPALEGDTFAINLIPRNLYARQFRNPDYLHHAFDQIKDNPRFRHLRGLYHALLMEHYFDSEKYDSMMMQIQPMMDDLPYVRDHGHRALIWFYKSLADAYNGDLETALNSRIEYENCVDRLRMQERSSEVIRLSALEELRKSEIRYELELSRRNWRIIFTVVIFVGGGVIGILLLNRRWMRQRLKMMANELELEKAKRKMAASALTIEENDRLLEDLRSELSDLRRVGEIREDSARKLESSIRTHLSGHDNKEVFQQMFDVVNPGFTDRLRELAPDLAESYVKLACYILMDLDNKKIAALMMVKPESVRQSRWRLKRLLKLPSEDNLESYLRNLNSSVSSSTQDGKDSQSKNKSL